MNNRALTLSIVMAFIALFFVQSYVGSIEDEAKKKFGTEVLVLRAKQNIKEMDTINETMLDTVLIPKRFLDPASIYWDTKEVTPDVIRDRKSVIGAIAAVPILKGEQIARNKITEPGIRTGLAPQVTPGRRAFAVPVTEVSGVAKLVKPGDRVDLIAVLDMGAGKENKVAKTVLQDVVVLSTGKSVTNNSPRLLEADAFGGKDKIRSLAEDTSFASVTLEVTPEQAQSLALVLSNGDNSLSLSLRNNDDTERTNVNSTVFSDVLGTDAGRVRMPANKR
ncbi:Flp pilus assembly protein CpaB [Bdellovibrionota bacterium FG-1]